MGYYIDNIGTTFTEKCNQLTQNHDAVETDASFKDDLVCVVDNGSFAAAGYCYSESEFEAFNSTSDRRIKKFFVVPEAKKLSGYT